MNLMQFTCNDDLLDVSNQYLKLYKCGVSLTESVCLAMSMVHVLGADRFLTDIELMLGSRPSNIWKYSWKFVAPVALLVRVLSKTGGFRAVKP